MRYFRIGVLALAAVLCSASLAIAQTTCTQQATKTGISTLVEVIQGSGSATLPALGGTARIYVCGYTASISAAGNVTFSYGTGTNCGTGTTAVGPTLQFAGAGTLIDGSAFYRGFSVPASQSLCATASAGTAVVTFYYIQQ